ncbi:MAG TPA: TIGR04282 family arsenosugar biosynthesis glycosyltransferase [Acidimicrobiia bacterium]|nr:TIGR04282 family arsenosugar biosynthesis glycosyltransferase [Acidimicrobiia bacterium]
MTTVVVMAKEPRPGRVKTRLCPPCTPRQAATIAAAALADTLAAVDASGCHARVLAFAGRSESWRRAGWSVVPQVAGGLGQRIGAAVASFAGPVLVVGMDTPQLTPTVLDDACARLTAPDVDAVLGPADDGGYWAIGFRDRRAGAFDDVEMSTSDTGRQQRARLDALGLRVTELPRLRDVDTIEDARSVAALAPASHFAHALQTSVGAR